MNALSLITRGFIIKIRKLIVGSIDVNVEVDKVKIKVDIDEINIKVEVSEP